METARISAQILPVSKIFEEARNSHEFPKVCSPNAQTGVKVPKHPGHRVPEGSGFEFELHFVRLPSRRDERV